MARRPRGRQAPTGRGKPHGPVHALARTGQQMSLELKYDRPITETDPYTGEERTVDTRTRFESKRFKVEMLALSAGQIGVEAVANQQFDIAPGQRRPIQYAHDGSPEFDMTQLVMDKKDWEIFGEAGQLILVRGSLARLQTINGARAQYDFQPTEWGLADPAQHAQGKLALPLAV